MVAHPHPRTVTTEIIRDYPGRFVIEEIELRRLINDINNLLKPESANQTTRIRYWIGLKNGIVYEIDDIDILFSEENSQELTIVIIIILGELLDQSKKQVRRIIIHFSRGKPIFSTNILQAENGENFNLKFHGVSYRIKEKNRDLALKMIEIVESRLNKFKRWYSYFREFRVNPILFVLNWSIFVLFALLSYALAAAIPSINNILGFQDINDWDRIEYFPRFTSDFLMAVTISILLMIGLLILSILILHAINWIVPPSVIAIGDEKQTYIKAIKLREKIFWGIIVAGIVSAIVNYFV